MAAAIKSVEDIRNQINFLDSNNIPDIISRDVFEVNDSTISSTVPISQANYAYIKRGGEKTRLYTTGADPCILLGAYIMNSNNECIGAFLAHYDTVIQHSKEKPNILTLKDYKEKGTPYTYQSISYNLGQVTNDVKEYTQIYNTIKDMVAAFLQNEEYILINYVTFSGWTILPYSLLMYAIRDIFKDIMNKERNKKIRIHDYGHSFGINENDIPSDKMGIDIENPKFYYKLNIDKHYIPVTRTTSERMDKPTLGYVRAYPSTTQRTVSGGDKVLRRTDKKKYIYGRDRVIYINSRRKEYVRYNHTIVAVSRLPRSAFTTHVL